MLMKLRGLREGKESSRMGPIKGGIHVLDLFWVK
jgi:hypothetical protein